MGEWAVPNDGAKLEVEEKYIFAAAGLRFRNDTLRLHVRLCMHLCSLCTVKRR